MSNKFDPAPHDKHAESKSDALKADKKTSEDLRAGLVGSFPASDPVSAVQPAKTVEDGDHWSEQTKTRSK